MESYSLLWVFWCFFFSYLAVIHTLDMPPNNAERSTVCHNLFQWPELPAFFKKAQGHFEFSFQVETLFALGNIPDLLDDMNIGYSPRFFILMQFSWKGNPCLQEYKDRKSLSGPSVILKKTWSKICCLQMGNVVMMPKVGSILYSLQ